ATRGGMEGCLTATWILLGAFMMQNVCRVTVSSAQELAKQVESVPPSNFAIPQLPHADSRQVRVFDNALLDNLFAKQRAAAKGKSANSAELAALPGLRQKSTVAPSLPVLLLPTDSFAAEITSRTPSRLAAALRFAERGRREIESRRYQRAVNNLETAISLGVRNYLPYVYYYLAQTHYHLANYESASNFLEAAEAWLSGQSDWMRSVVALRRDNINAMGYVRASSGAHIR
ncbi:MAG TPA: hypothetical protein VHM64_16940, partial [Candidatus Binatia bacterium]|nr:hypothetical protein [Candidatus Binatia bacterium]